MICLSVILIYSQIAQDHHEWMHGELKHERLETGTCITPKIFCLLK